MLVLDESVSMLDAVSGRALTDAIAQVRRGRTCLLIAHRLSTILTADLVAVVDGGRVVDTGTHTELLARCDVDRRLVEPQLLPTVGEP